MVDFIEPTSIDDGRINIMGVDFNLDEQQWDWMNKDVSDYTQEDIFNADMYQNAVSGYGGSASALLCPVSHTCVAEPGTNGMFVRSQQNGTLYFSAAGYNRYVNGANVNWAGVARDLTLIAAGSIGGAGGALAAIATLLGTAAWGIDFLRPGGTGQ